MSSFAYVNPKCLISKVSKKLEITKDFAVYYVANKESVSFLDKGLTGNRIDLELVHRDPEFVIRKYFKDLAA